MADRVSDKLIDLERDNAQRDLADRLAALADEFEYGKIIKIIGETDKSIMEKLNDWKQTKKHLVLIFEEVKTMHQAMTTLKDLQAAAVTVWFFTSN